MRVRERISALRAWLAGERSDTALWLIIILLANIAAADIYLRADLTRGNVYTLSGVSRELVRSVDEPLSVKVYFSRDLPAPYNGVERYLRDLLEEYRRAAGDDFTVVFHDMEEPANKESASGYGIQPARIQEIKSDQFQSRSVYMGLTIIYGDAIETIDQITESAGLEYRLTTAMQKMISSVDALHAITGKPLLTLYASPSLAEFGIEGFDGLEGYLEEAVDSLEPAMRDRIELRTEYPGQEELDRLKEEFGVQILRWQESLLPDGKKIEAGSGVLDLVLSYGGRSSLIPLNLSRKLFGGYAVSGLENLSVRIEETLTGLLSPNPAIGYLAGHGEHELFDPRTGSAPLEQLLSDMYTIEIVEAGGEEDEAPLIPASIRTLIINGPKSRMDSRTLYEIDQFLMRGGSLIVFSDPYDVVEPDTYGRPPEYIPVSTGLEEQLAAYGVRVGRGYVMDTESFIQRDRQYGDLSIYWAPVLSGAGIDDGSVITRGLGELIALQNAPLSITGEAEDSDRIDARVLLSSSEKSWVAEENIQLNPLAMIPPGEEKMGSRPLAVSLEGSFSSAFPGPPAEEQEEGPLAAAAHLDASVAPGRIAVVSSSLFTTVQLLDPASINGNSAFVHNLVDWAGGNDRVIPMRVKGLGRNKLVPTTPEVRNVIKGTAIILLPLLVVFSGLLVWRFQKSRRRSIELRFTRGESHAEK